MPIHASTPERKIKSGNKKPFVPLRIINVNCQSIRNKQSQVENVIDSLKPDVVIATETWLDPNINNNQIIPSNYNVYRKDRKGKVGGGVLIAIHEKFLSSEIPELDTDSEIVWARIQQSGTKDLRICAYYNPKVTDDLTSFEESVRRACNSNSNILIAGDFNLPGWLWKEKILKPGTQHTRNHYHLANILDDNGLTQMVETPTRNTSTLDLVITNIPSRIQHIDTTPGISDHDIVYAEMDINPVKTKQKPRTIPLYKRANWMSIQEEMKELKSKLEEDETNGASTDDLWNTFKRELTSSTSRHIPTKTARQKDKLPWISKEIRSLIKRRDRAFKCKKKTNHKDDIKRYKDLKHQVQRKSRRAYWDYIEGIVTPESEEGMNTRGPSKRFWTYIKHRKTDKNGVSPLKRRGKIETDPVNQANILNDQFKSVFSDSITITEEEFTRGGYMNDTTSNYPVAEDINITETGVLKLLKNLNVHKAGGPDDIKPAVLKELAEEIAPLLTIIYRTSLRSGTIPQDWKKARITPAFKKGQRYQASNYRPISLTCVCCKIMEHIVTSHIMKHSENNNILYPLQHGFRSQRSCETQLLECVDDLTTNLEMGKQTDLLILDFSKAFDKVSHSLLLHKLQHYGIRGQTNNWIRAFLADRTQVVVVDGAESSVGRVESGVPQGSVLGPSLFLFYINDLPDNLHSTVRLFADDTIVYLTISSETDCQTLQNDLDKLALWETKWKMEFHPDKCTVLTVSKKKQPLAFNYTLHGHILQHETSTKYLGCTLTSDLNWGTHISNICSKANRTLGFLQRNLHISSRNIKQQAYKTLVRPQLEYSSTVWDPYQQGHIDLGDNTFVIEWFAGINCIILWSQI